MRYSTALDINLGILESNFEKLRSSINNNQIIFMVKANAYGHGLFDIVKYAYENFEVKHFGVASLKEAVLLRTRIPFMKADIFVFSDTAISDSERVKNYLEYNIRPVVSNLKDLELLCSNKDFKNLPISITFNTGMNRLGIAMDELEKTVDLLRRFNITHVDHLMSHFSSSYLKLKANCMSYQQIENFDKIKFFFKDSNISFEHTSMANSGAIEKKLTLDETFVRPGIMLYGPQSSMTGDKLWDGQIISRFYTKVLRKFDVSAGDTLGYGNHCVKNAGVVIVLAIGYGDGIHTSYSGKNIFIDNIEGQVVGRINMDLTFVYFPNDPKLKVDQIVSLWSNEQKSIARLEKSLQTISYELFCSLTVRIPRLYSLN
jgi:alanine racemase